MIFLAASTILSFVMYVTLVNIENSGVISATGNAISINDFAGSHDRRINEKYMELFNHYIDSGLKPPEALIKLRDTMIKEEGLEGWRNRRSIFIRKARSLNDKK